jgi:hypothetical protein
VARHVRLKSGNPSGKQRGFKSLHADQIYVIISMFKRKEKKKNRISSSPASSEGGILDTVSNVFESIVDALPDPRSDSHTSHGDHSSHAESCGSSDCGGGDGGGGD